MTTSKALAVARLQAREAHVDAFKALAHLSRLQIVFFLVRAGRELAAGEIQAELEIPARPRTGVAAVAETPARSRRSSKC